MKIFKTTKIQFKHSIVALTAAIILIGFSSCTSYKNLHQSPQIDATEILRDVSISNDTITIADIPWINYFTDTHLQALINEALDNNIDLKIAANRIKQAEANLLMADAAIQPTLTAVGQVNHSRGGSDGKLLNKSMSQPMLGFSTSWEIDIWGKLNSLTKAQYANYLNSQEYKNLIQTNIIANVAKTYYALLALDKKMEITQQTIELLTQSTETLQLLMESGQQNAAAVEQSRALLYNTQLSIPEIEKQIRQQENALSLLLNRKFGNIERSTIETQQFDTVITKGVPAQWLSRRPDMKQAEYNLLAAYSITDAAQAAFYPSLTLSSATLGLGANGFQNFFSLESIAANIIGGITQPIFNKKQLDGNLKIAQSRQEEALLNFRQTALSAGKEVSDILYSFDVLQRKSSIRSQQLTSLTNAVSYTLELLIAGEATYIEVLNSQQNLLSAQIAQIEDQHSQLILNVGLYKALGGGK